ncbi:hypothetical protein BAE44_0016094 [Dichanthelium oligosanthes]|uniref:Uncharacterized protein n=1 Tax=Dichanthelium oligosanthes TaxID=888268 RepID=A0A1E5VCL7_9POAL|nr:hypothetical protein BAE44_0016094 [Dichanthelium oligosanthes]
MGALALADPTLDQRRILSPTYLEATPPPPPPQPPRHNSLLRSPSLSIALDSLGAPKIHPSRLMAAAATAARKRPAPDGACPSTAAAPAPAKKRARRYQFASIHDYEKLEEIGEGT